MKTKYWVLILGILAAVCAVSGFFLLRGNARSDTAQILSNGNVIRTVNLAVDQEFTVELEDGSYNTVTVRDGAIAVTAASCPDQYCARRGWCSGGAQIVCLPNRLVIRFLGEQEVDIAAGQ